MTEEGKTMSKERTCLECKFYKCERCTAPVPEIVWWQIDSAAEYGLGILSLYPASRLKCAKDCECFKRKMETI